MTYGPLICLTRIITGHDLEVLPPASSLDAQVSKPPIFTAMAPINTINITPRLLNTSCAWSSSLEDLQALYNSRYTGAITTRTAYYTGGNNHAASASSTPELAPRCALPTRQRLAGSDESEPFDVLYDDALAAIPVVRISFDIEAHLKCDASSR